MVGKVSEITAEHIANYIRLDAYDVGEIETYLNVAKSYISNYTGIPVTSDEESLDSFEDFIIVVYVLCQDMYDNRTMPCFQRSFSMPPICVTGAGSPSQ